MISVALKLVRNNRFRFLVTVIGFSFTVFILLLGMYYLGISKNVLEDNLNNAISEQMILVDHVYIPLAHYYEVGNEFLPTYEEISDDDIVEILSQEGVESARTEYLAPEELKVSIDGVTVRIGESYAVDAHYDTFPRARVKRLEEMEENFTPILSGQDFSGDSPYEVLLNEVFVVSMGWLPNETIGKEIILQAEGIDDIRLEVIGVYSHEMSSWYGTDISEFYGDFMLAQMEEYEIPDAVLFNRLLFDELAVQTGRIEYSKPYSIECYMPDSSNIEEFETCLYKRFGLNIVSDYLDFYFQLDQQVQYQNLFLLVGVIMSFLVMIMVTNSVSINIYQQKRFVGLLSLLGYRRRNICQLYAFQSLMYGLIGSLIGGLLGFIVTTFLGLKSYANLRDFGFQSSKLLLPVRYVLLVVFVFNAVCYFWGFLVAWVQTRRRT